jgi:hypothetical protein
MRPIRQTETVLGRGNCLAACIASLLDLSIEDVPNFRTAEDQWGALQAWLSDRGLCAIRVAAQPSLISSMPPQYCILTGPSPRNPVLHAVIGLWEGERTAMVHDPHPDGTGLAGPVEYVTFLGKLAL